MRFERAVFANYGNESFFQSVQNNIYFKSHCFFFNDIYNMEKKSAVFFLLLRGICTSE